jgi:hypothetical protein
LILGSILCGLPLPLLATQIFWINLIQHGFMHIALIFEPGEPDIMNRPPKAKNEPILNYDMKFLIFSPKIESHQMHPYSSPNAVRLNSKQLQLGLLIDFLKVSIDNLEKTVTEVLVESLAADLRRTSYLKAGIKKETPQTNTNDAWSAPMSDNSFGVNF